MKLAMRRPGLLLAAIAACSDPASDDQVFEFGPFELAAQQEVTSDCVQISLNNAKPIFVNSVELTTGPGFHHSNWFFVPEHVFAGPDGTFRCDDRFFDIASAAATGGVFFAQSTQSPHEVQAFPEGMAVRIPANHKLVAQIHLLNRGDEPLAITPTIGIKTLQEANVETVLSGVSMEFHPLSLPPRMQSRFSVECDLAPFRDMPLQPRSLDFNIYYTLAHYHEWGTRMLLEAVKADGTAATIYTTQAAIGDSLGGILTPPFDFDGYERLRLTCEYYNNTDSMIFYGNGDGEMCVFLAFSDSPYMWGGGALDTQADPSSGVNQGGVMSYTRGCQLYSLESK